MPLRRSFATTMAALVTVPLLASCGFAYNTDRVYTPGVGTFSHEGEVDVLAAVIVAAQPGEGTFIATLSNNSQTGSASFESLSGTGEDAATADDVDPVEIAPGGFVNLADGGGVKLTGSFGAGDFVPLSVGFADGELVDLEVPVVRACQEYADLDPAGSESSAPTRTPSGGTQTVEPSATASPSAAASESAAAEIEDAEPYSCDFPRVGSTADSGEGE